MNDAHIILAEGYWMNTPLAVARSAGGVRFRGCEYLICNKDGLTVFEISAMRKKGTWPDKKWTIAPGELADLVQRDWIPIYRKLKREKFVEIALKKMSLKEARDYVKSIKD